MQILYRLAWPEKEMMCVCRQQSWLEMLPVWMDVAGNTQTLVVVSIQSLLHRSISGGWNLWYCFFVMWANSTVPAEMEAPIVVLVSSTRSEYSRFKAVAHPIYIYMQPAHIWEVIALLEHSMFGFCLCLNRKLSVLIFPSLFFMESVLSVLFGGAADWLCESATAEQETTWQIVSKRPENEGYCWHFSVREEIEDRVLGRSLELPMASYLRDECMEEVSAPKSSRAQGLWQSLLSSTPETLGPWEMLDM